MAVDVTQVPFADWLRMYGRVEVRRWVYDPGGYWQIRHVYLGWLPDGRWWCKRTGDLHGWLFTGDVQVEVRAAAEAKAAELRNGTGWQPAQILEGGAIPARPAKIREWPPGREPG